MIPANHLGATVAEALFREHGQQVAALCWRAHAKGVEILLVTSLNSKRWILPKGWAEPDLSLPESAAREAFEEAGVTGQVEAGEARWWRRALPGRCLCAETHQAA
jgi:8-oxo-dGTP pyrophosphatase MutT (NUDIX family)